MTNDELIQALREDAEWAHGNEWETPITLGDHLDAAADALEAAAKRIAELETAQRWIPVSEKMPELPNSSYCSIGVIATDGKTSFYRTYERTVVRGKTVERWMYPWDRISDESITHWQPLPSTEGIKSGT